MKTSIVRNIFLERNMHMRVAIIAVFAFIESLKFQCYGANQGDGLTACTLIEYSKSTLTAQWKTGGLAKTVRMFAFLQEAVLGIIEHSL